MHFLLSTLFVYKVCLHIDFYRIAYRALTVSSNVARYEYLDICTVQKASTGRSPLNPMLQSLW